MSKSKLRLMRDYTSDGLWREDGVGVDPEKYGFSPSFLLALRTWCWHCDHHLNDEDGYPTSAPFCNEFAGVMGEALLKQAVAELGDRYDFEIWDERLPDGGLPR